MSPREVIGWSLLAAGGAFGVAAAALQGGWITALTTASGVCTAAASTWAFVNKPPAPKA